MNKLLSIVIIVYNGEKFLHKLFSSLTDNKNVEIIIINDGSTDDSLNVIEEHIKDKENMYVYSKENGGQSTARNLGIEKAKGKYILFADCDDYFTKDAFDTILDSIKNKSDLYVYDFNQVIEGKEKSSWLKMPDEKNYMLDKKNIVRDCLNGKINDLIAPSLWNKVFKKDVIVKNKIKFIEGQKLYEDMLFNLEYLTHCNNICITKDKIYNYVIHNESITRRYKSWLTNSLENLYNVDCNESPISVEVQEEFCRNLIVLCSAQFNCLINLN